MKLTTYSIVCRDAVELVSDYLEGALSRRDSRRLEKHLKGCPNCSAYLEQIRVTIAVAGEVSPNDLSPEALSDLVDLYRRFRSPLE